MNERKKDWFDFSLQSAGQIAQHLTFTPRLATHWRCGAEPSRAKVSRQPLEGCKSPDIRFSSSPLNDCQRGGYQIARGSHSPLPSSLSPPLSLCQPGTMYPRYCNLITSPRGTAGISRELIPLFY